MLPTNLGIMFESTPFGFPSNEMLLLKLEKKYCQILSLVVLQFHLFCQ